MAPVKAEAGLAASEGAAVMALGLSVTFRTAGLQTPKSQSEIRFAKTASVVTNRNIANIAAGAGQSTDWIAPSLQKDSERRSP